MVRVNNKKLWRTRQICEKHFPRQQNIGFHAPSTPENLFVNFIPNFVSHLEIDFEIVQVHGFFDALGPKRASTCCCRASNEWLAHDHDWGHLKLCPTMCGRSKSAIINENGIGPTLIYTLCFILIEFHKLLSALKSILLFILFLAKNKTKYLFLSN